MISEIWRPSGSQNVRNAVLRIGDNDAYLSVVTIGELKKGISLLVDGQRKQALTTWLAVSEEKYAGRILGVDQGIAHVWGEMTASAQLSGKNIPALDGLIAATAKYYDFAVMTRNVDDFASSGVKLINPWNDSRAS